MSLVHELAASVQCCFELFGSQSDGVLLTRHDQAQLNEISSILQPLLLRLQKQAVSVAETQELFAEDEGLLNAVVHLRRSLESLQSTVGRCRVSHWLLRVLTAEDVRQSLERGLANTSDALQELLQADATADVGPLHDVAALHQSLCDHKVVRHEGLERLGTGLYKHMEQATEAEQVVAMLRFVVREAQNLMMKRKHGRPSSSGGAGGGGHSRRDSDASDVSRGGAVDQDSKHDASNNNSNGSTAMDTGSSSDGSSSSKNNNGSSSSKGKGGSSSIKPSDVPPGETSLTDVQLLLGVQQMADSKEGTQQLVLHQILSILEELHEHKAHQLKHRQMKRNSTGGTHTNGGAAHSLQSVPEGLDDTIAAVRGGGGGGAAKGGAGAGAHYPYGGQQHPYGSGTGIAAAMAASRMAQQQQQYGGGGGQPVTYGTAVAAVSGGLEELLWADPWDTAALTQLLELLLQAAAVDEFVEVDEDQEGSGSSGAGADSSSNSSGGSSSKDNNNRSKNGKNGKKTGKWWGQAAAAAKAALQSARSSSFTSKGGSSRGAGGSGRSSSAAPSEDVMDAYQRQRQERVHQLVASALDVLLHLTPLPATADSCFKPLSRPEMPSYRSLALPLMAHCDAITALSGCIWSSWPDVATKAARLITILVRSEGIVQDSAGMAAAAGLPSAPEAVYLTFCHALCTSGGVSGSVWHGLVTLLHNSNLASAAAAAEAIAAIGSSGGSHELCSSLAASQAARALLLLLGKHQLHLGAGGSAAAALHGLSDAHVRPGMHDLLISSYIEQVNGTAVPMGDSCVAIMLSTDCLAACRAARLAASLAHGVNWTTAAASSSGANGSSLWSETFRAGQHLLQRNRSSTSSGGEEGSPTVAGARLLQQLVLYGCPHDEAAPAADASGAGVVVPDDGGRSREEMCLEALVVVLQKLRGYDVCRQGKEGQVQALVELLSALLSHMSEARVCGALPEVHAVVMPLLETLQRKGGGSGSGGSSATNNNNNSNSNSGGSSSSAANLQMAAEQLHEQLMVLGG